MTDFKRPPMATIKLLANSGRLYWALVRVSRDRYLYPQEVMRVGMALARCLSPARPAWVLDAAIQKSCQAVGMLRGHPPLNTWEPMYLQLVELVQRKPKNIEFEILKLTLKGL